MHTKHIKQPSISCNEPHACLGRYHFDPKRREQRLKKEPKLGKFNYGTEEMNPVPFNAPETILEAIKKNDGSGGSISEIVENRLNNRPHISKEKLAVVQCAKEYKVQSGDSCWKIATDNGLSLEVFLRLNPKLDCGKLAIGSQVCVKENDLDPNPRPSPPNSTLACTHVETVKEGQGCWQIWTAAGYTLLAFDMKLLIVILIIFHHILPSNYGKPTACGQFNYLLRKLKSISPDVRVYLSIGGWYDSNYFSPATSPKYVDNFVESIARWLAVFPFAGIDIDWEYPYHEHGCEPIYPDTSCVGDPELRNAGPYGNGIKPHGQPYELIIAAPAGHDKYMKMDLKSLCDSLDYVNFMT
ncbi:uncharacterized protein VTP21DRAFT_9730 [Calcarisporiella thermophila]|uniref:uncharacterized protein n=1 Tax=Calcarisporiella thermophila TaxID=911321 RepID=UPI00374392CE